MKRKKRHKNVTEIMFLTVSKKSIFTDNTLEKVKLKFEIELAWKFEASIN